MSDSLYHYTDSAATLGILGKPGEPAALWMTHILFMNDSAEWHHANGYRAEVLEAWEDDPEPAVREFVRYERDRRARRTDNLDQWVVFSLSSNPDQLSQWRGYAPNGGCCIEFDHAALAASAQAAQGFGRAFFLRACLYDDKLKREAVNVVMNYVRGHLIAGTFASGIANPYLPAVPRAPLVWSVAVGAAPSNLERVHHHASQCLDEAFAFMATHFKHDSFGEEDEVRLVGRVQNPLRLRTRGSTMVPFYPFEIEAHVADSSLIKSVTIGPRDDFELQRLAILLSLHEGRSVKRHPLLAGNDGIRRSNCTWR